MADAHPQTDLLGLLFGRWWVVAISIVLGVGIALIALQVVPPTFTATATQLVKGIPGTGAGSNYMAAQFSEARARSYPAFIASTTVMQGVREDLGPEFTDAKLREQLSAINPAGTPLVKVTATGQSAQDARDLANSAARRLALFITEIEVVKGRSPVLVEIAVQAGLPTHPSFPSKTLFLALGASGGAALGIAAIFARNALAARRDDGFSAPSAF